MESESGVASQQIRAEPRWTDWHDSAMDDVSEAVKRKPSCLRMKTA